MPLLTGLLSVVAALLLPADPASAAAGMTAAYLYVDRSNGRTLAASQSTKQIRTASIVKLLIAIDYLEARDPHAPIPPADIALLEPMLRSSDDDAASTLWDRGGQSAVVTRTAAKLRLQQTQPPADPNWWGYTATSAADVVRIYRYLLEAAHPNVRDFVMGNVHNATQCATDGFDQYFGIPRAVPRPWGIKQGWSKYGDHPPPGKECRPVTRAAGVSPSAEEAPPGVTPTAGRVDLTSPAMHTSGVLGTGDRRILVILTLQPTGSGWDESAARLTTLTREIYAAS